MDQKALRFYIAVALLDRLERLWRGLQSDIRVEAGLLIAQCECIFNGAIAV